MAVTYTPLDELTTEQLDNILSRFQLVSPNASDEEKICLIRCIGLFDSKFRDYENSNVLVGFNKSGNLHDMKSEDDSVKLYDNSDPCNTCGKNVDKKDIGFRCCSCTEFFHNRCTSSPLPNKAFDTIATTPAWIKVFCPKCVAATNRSAESLQEIKQGMDELKSKVDVNSKETSRSYSKVTEVKRDIDTSMNRLAKSLVRPKNQNSEQEMREENDRTRLIKKPLDSRVKERDFIFKTLNNEYPGKLIRRCRTTAAGSIIVEFENGAAAQEVEDNWRITLFGGNSGIIKINQQKSTGIVKHIYQNLSQEQIIAEIEKTYPNSKYDFFQHDGNFTGTLKITFKDENTLTSAKFTGLGINLQKYAVEDYKYKPKVIKCNRCQKFGHIERLCNSETPKCAKCATEGHKTDDCVVESANYKCAHCSQNHITGSKICEVIRNKESQLANRNNAS